MALVRFRMIAHSTWSGVEINAVRCRLTGSAPSGPAAVGAAVSCTACVTGRIGVVEPVVPQPVPPVLPVSVKGGEPPAPAVAAGAGAVLAAMFTVTRYTPARRPAVSQSNSDDVSGNTSASLVWNGPAT